MYADKRKYLMFEPSTTLRRGSPFCVERDERTSMQTIVSPFCKLIHTPPRLIILKVSTLFPLYPLPPSSLFSTSHPSCIPMGWAATDKDIQYC